MADYSDAATALAAVRDPATSSANLQVIALAQPDLRAAIAHHPNANRSLLDWLYLFGDDAVKDAVTARRAQTVAEPVWSTAPHVSTSMGWLFRDGDGTEEPPTEWPSVRTGPTTPPGAHPPTPATAPAAPPVPASPPSAAPVTPGPGQAVRRASGVTQTPVTGPTTPLPAALEPEPQPWGRIGLIAFLAALAVGLAAVAFYLLRTPGDGADEPTPPPSADVTAGAAETPAPSAAATAGSEEEARALLDRQADSDSTFATNTLYLKWSPVLAALQKKDTNTFQAMWRQWTQFKEKYPDAVLIHGNAWANFRLTETDYLVDAGVAFATSDEALEWCRDNDLWANNLCYAMQLGGEYGQSAKYIP
ncbi:MAG: hypothetical protein LBR33_00265 [Propionibacteriaceae bacterium]|jgi:hypothetical protein|nr:hypothetical protein [Propionibacteriaceae bacterium]